MSHVFVWTLSDVVGLALLAVILLIVAVVVVVSWINDATRRIPKGRK